MTQWTRTIGRQITNSLPAWRAAMASTNTLYNVSADIPNAANASLVLPVIPYGWGTTEDQGWDVMSGYSSGVLLEDVGGVYGTIAIGTGGHTRVQNNLLSLNLSQASPNFGWWQQPYFQTSAANGAELYWNPTEFAALPASRKTGITGADEVSMTATWLANGGFAQGSMGYCGWMFPGKLTYGQLGNNNPHGFRYNSPCYVPASMTGTGAGAYMAFQAPFGPFAQSWAPSGSSTSDMLVTESMWPNGSRKYPIWAKNTATGAWSRLSMPEPDVRAQSFIRIHTAVSPIKKRVYASVDSANTGTMAYWYLDFTNGLAGVTMSSVVTSAIGSQAPNRGSPGCFTEGSPYGTLLWYWPDLNFTNYFSVQDTDNGTHYRVGPIAGYNIAANTEDTLVYDRSANRMLWISRPSGNTIVYRTISIPSNPANAAGYVVGSPISLSADASVVFSNLDVTWYKKVFMHEALGVVFIPQARGRMLAFRPA